MQERIIYDEEWISSGCSNHRIFTKRNNIVQPQPTKTEPSFSHFSCFLRRAARRWSGRRPNILGSLAIGYRNTPDCGTHGKMEGRTLRLFLIRMPPSLFDLRSLLFQISMAQIMTRLHLTWCGLPGPQVATKNTFKVVLMILAAYILYSTSLELASIPYDPENLPPLLWALKSLGSTAFSVYSIFSLCNTRRSVRIQYSIPEERCYGYEDCVCATCCTCCTLAQMARHTGEYETYPGVYFTKTGHPEGTPLTV